MKNNLQWTTKKPTVHNYPLELYRQALVREIMYENDEGSYRPETPEQRWIRVRAGVVRQLHTLMPREGG